MCHLDELPQDGGNTTDTTILPLNPNIVDNALDRTRKALERERGTPQIIVKGPVIRADFRQAATQSTGLVIADK